MVQEADGQYRTPEHEFTAALGALTTALEDAAKAAQALQNLTPSIANLSGLIADLENRMDRARQVLGQQPATADAPLPRPVALPSPHDERPIGEETLDAIAKDEAPTPEAAKGSDDGDRNPCYVLDVRSISGPLDLKAVDSSVNGNPHVVDVALLDYDGQRATLKVWFDRSASLPDARASLQENLQRHLAGQPADISIEPAEEAAA